ncbi:hypothetical protein I3843_16G002500 [Carya illinoinensis]|nr:hypothetical protein I3843_16G002500 [Carya illinoinensis]
MQKPWVAHYNAILKIFRYVKGTPGQAARDDKFYYPPEWARSQGSLNKFHGQHALRERARKIDEGIYIDYKENFLVPSTLATAQLLRLLGYFEMPYNVWCGGCNSMIAKGVRLNADKKQVGNYYSTKSVCCRHEIVIQTDPKTCEYVIISGAQRKAEEFDIEDAETFALPLTGKLSDPFYRLEHQEEDLQKKKEAEPVLVVCLRRVSDARHSDDHALNKALRAQLRNQKKRVAEEEAISRKRGLGIRLLPPSEEDASSAASPCEDKRALINAASIFFSSSGSCMSTKRHLGLESKRRKINAALLHMAYLLGDGYKRSSR